MEIEVKKTDHGTILVNGKEVFPSGDAWQARTGLTNDEQIALMQFLNKDKPATTTITASVLNEVMAERKRQDAKWGADRNHHPLEWLAILGEEVGEVNRHALEVHFAYPDVPTDLSLYRKELVQVAAVSVAMIESLDRQNATKPVK